MRLIDADALIQKRNHAKAYAQDMYVIGQGYVMDAPTIEAAPVVRGEWVYHYDDLFPMESTQECSVCHEEEYITLYNDNYCPNCGAKMEDKPCG